MRTTNGEGDLPILIIGAGIGGLAAALALLRRGFDVAVFEQAPELREVGAGVQISPNGSRVLQALGVLDDVRASACETEGKEVRLWNSGQTWKLFDLGAQAVKRYGFPYFTVYRVDLHNALIEAVRREKPDAIRLSARCVGFAQDSRSVSVDFQDGSRANGRALIGADGIHSIVRSSSLEQTRPAMPTCWRGAGSFRWRKFLRTFGATSAPTGSALGDTSSTTPCAVVN